MLVSSNHQKNIIKNNPYGSFLRIRRICSYTHNYIYFAKKLINQLISRGYNRKKLEKISDSVLKIEPSGACCGTEITACIVGLKKSSSTNSG